MTDRFSKYQILSNGKLSIKNVKEVSVIGNGSFGQVFQSIHTPSNNLLAVKKTKLSIKGRNCLKKNIPFESDEYKIHLYVNEILLERRSQNFLFVYGKTIVENCNIVLNTKSYQTYCHFLFLEIADGSLADLPLHQEQLQYNIFFQLLTALQVLQSRYSFLHNDIKTENILILRTTPGGLWEYVIDGNTYYVKNLGYVALISDFGVSRSFDPRYTLDGYLGERNAFVKDGKFSPLETDCYLSRDDKTGKITKLKPQLLNWESPMVGTRNKFYKRFSFPKELDILPPFEFFYDLQDLIRMFIGGKRLSQPEKHKGIDFLTESFKKKLETYRISRNFYNTKWSADSVLFFLASFMIKEFSTYFSEQTEKVINRFIS